MRTFLIAAVCWLTTLSALAAPELTDAEAKNLLETYARAQLHRIKLGPLVVSTQEDLERSPGAISQSTYKTYQAFEKLGLVSITREYPSGFTGWQEVRLFVGKTPQGEEAVKRDGLPQKEGWMVMRRVVAFHVEKIVKNEGRREGTDDFRILLFSYSVKRTPEMARLQEVLGLPHSEKMKARWLLKFDPFRDEWKTITADIASVDQEFTTNWVSRGLSR